MAPLLNQEDSENLRKRWIEIQGKFVDEPRDAVQQADALVSEVLKQVIQVFASEHSTLESQWNQGSNVSTEDLRKALQHYRSFFNRLVVLKQLKIQKALLFPSGPQLISVSGGIGFASVQKNRDEI